MTAATCFPLDARLWPVVIAVSPSLPMDDDVWHRHFAELETLRARGERFALVVDARGAAPPTPAQRRLITDALEGGERRHPGSMTTAVVVDSAAAAGVVTILRWFVPRLMPMRPFSSMELALAWARREVLRAPPAQPTAA
jgi:hypothetical protein